MPSTSNGEDLISAGCSVWNAQSDLMVVMPDLVARPRIESPNIVRNGEIQNAVDQQRRGLDFRWLLGLECPVERKIFYVLRRDLGEGTVASARIVTVITGPTV